MCIRDSTGLVLKMLVLLMMITAGDTPMPRAGPKLRTEGMVAESCFEFSRRKPDACIEVECYDGLPLVGEDGTVRAKGSGVVETDEYLISQQKLDAYADVVYDTDCDKCNGESGSICNPKLAGVYHTTIPPYCLLYTSPSPRDATLSRMPSSA